MSLLTDHWYVDIISLAIVAVTLFLTWVHWSQKFWERRGIPTPPTAFFFGHVGDVLLQKESAADFVLRLYRFLRKEKARHGGTYAFSVPSYLAVDLDIIKRIMQTDFDHFVDRGMYHNEESDPLSAHLFSLDGAKWRNLRIKLTPTFTSGKMKMMFETLVKCGDQLIVETDKNLNEGPLDVKDILGRFTTDIIGNCAFGLNCNSIENPDSEIPRHLKMFFVAGFKQNLAGIFSMVAPNLSRKIGLKITNPTLETFFMKMVKDTVNYREKNNIYRKDFMHLLLQLKNRGKLVDDESVIGDGGSEVALTMNELAAQAYIFFLAGFETSSTTMTFCLFELATNPDIQEKLRQEVGEVLERHDNKLTYDAVMEMHYMEKVINETLRKYPPLPTLNRVCTKDWTIPGTEVVLKKGMPIGIPVIGIQRDPDYFPDPEKFDPERFSEGNKKKRPAFTFLPFGDGPRNCIGLRFGMLQTKVGLSVLLKNYKFDLNSKTSLPLKFDPKSFIMSTEGGIWLDYTKV